jgi:hypothetical protein
VDVADLSDAAQLRRALSAQTPEAVSFGSISPRRVSGRSGGSSGYLLLPSQTRAILPKIPIADGISDGVMSHGTGIPVMWNVLPSGDLNVGRQLEETRRERSSAREPFSAFREIAPRLKIFDDVLGKTPWHPPPETDFEVDWIAFLAGAEPKLELLEPAVASFSRDSDLPIASLLVGYTASFFDFQSQFSAAPTLDEVQSQLDTSRDALSSAGRWG